MQQITLTFPATCQQQGRAMAGVVGSGDLEVLLVASAGDRLSVTITTSVDNSERRWQALFTRLAEFSALPAGQMTIHDFAATPGVARIRIEQVLEQLEESADA